MATNVLTAEGSRELLEKAWEASQDGSTPWQGPLAELVSNTKAVLLRPFAFFPSWSGVLTLAFSGYPAGLRTLKQDINNALTALAKENPGSRWPKTSLGCLKDGARLTPEQLQRLAAICVEESGVFQRPQSRRSQAVLVDQLEVVLYECRCLERHLSKHVIPMQPVLDISEPSLDEKERVQGIVNEVEAADYWFHASRDGNRETHYRDTALGATLVHGLTPFTGRHQPLVNAGLRSKGSAPVKSDSTVSLTEQEAGEAKAYGHALPAIISAFRRRVDSELPGLYTWFSDESLHVTIRALMG